ncbi:MAG: aminoacyl-tRNA hydrolase [Pseudomonadota bacterium]
MILIVGLGNPGRAYARHRHNIGFMAVDRIAADHGIAPFRAKFQGEIAEGRLGRTRVALLKPMTQMNASGQSVGEAMRYFKLAPEDVVVLHDELDLAPGKCRIKQGGGHAGHNGLRSLHAHIGPDFVRVRLGIGHPGSKAKVTGHVLGDFAKADQGWLEDLLTGLSDGAIELAERDYGRVMNKVALRTADQRPGAPAERKAGPAAVSEAPPANPDDGKGPLERLMAHFRR